jgi:hypothetical protein
VFRTSFARDTVCGAANFAREFEHLLKREVTIVETKEGHCSFFFQFNKTLLSCMNF